MIEDRNGRGRNNALASVIVMLCFRIFDPSLDPSNIPVPRSDPIREEFGGDHHDPRAEAAGAAGAGEHPGAAGGAIRQPARDLAGSTRATRPYHDLASLAAAGCGCD